MKFNIEIDIADIIDEARSEYFDYDDFKKEIISQVKSSIKYEVKESIYNSMKKDVLKDIENDLFSKLSEIADTVKNNIINDILNNESITPNPYSSRQVRAKDYIYSKITEDTKNCVRKIVDETSVNICNQLREKYDMAFATSIVNNMRKQKLLDEKTAKLLLGD